MQFFLKLTQLTQKQLTFNCKIQEVIGYMTHFISELLLFALWWGLGVFELLIF